MKLKKSSKHRCAVLDCSSYEDYPSLDFMPDSDLDYCDEFQLLEHNQDLAMVFSSLDVAAHDQEFQDAERYHGYTEFDCNLYYDDSDPYLPGYEGSYPQPMVDQSIHGNYGYEHVEIYDSSDVFSNYSDGYDHPDYSLETEPKVASPIPLPVYLSQALTQLIEKYGNVMPCDYEDSDEDADDSSGSDLTLNDDSSDPESDDQPLAKSLTWRPRISDAVKRGNL